MSEWKEYSLAEITEPIKNTYLPNGRKDFNYIGLEHIEQETLRLNGIGRSEEVSSNKFLFKANDVLFGKLRVYFRKVVKPPFDGICSTDIWVFRAKENLDQNFLFYFLANWDFVNLADGGEGGTRMPRADWNFLKTTKWKLPPLPEQKAIASILSSLDDKIDLLHRQNATLEKMAETLFRQWFVVEAKEEWESGTISNLAIHLKTSVNPQKHPQTEYKHYSIPSFDEEKKALAELGSNIQSNKYIVSKNSILFSKLNPHRDKRIWLLQDEVTENSVCSSEFQIVKPKNDAFLYFLYGWLSYDANYNEIASGIGGTSGSHQRIDPAAIFSLPCPKIPLNYVRLYNSLVQPLFKKQLYNQTQIRTLTNLRDTLLPKLMSGEIKVALKE